MLHLCNNFRIFGDGGDKVILIATNSDGKQEAYCIHNPRINSLMITSQPIDCTYFGDAYSHNFQSGCMTTKLELTAGECEFYQGINLDKQFDPVWAKSVKELLSIINNKLDQRQND